MHTTLKCLALGLLLIGGAASAQSRDESEVVMVGASDPEMVAAIRTARNGLDGFLKLAAAPPENTADFKLKVAVRDGQQVEHFWVIPFRPAGNDFEGVLSNTPRLVHNVKEGQLLRFTRDEISDWGYLKAGRQVGSFTVCVMFKKMSPEQAEYYRKNYGFDC